MTTQNPIAVADNISKRFYATQALEDVSLKFNAGEVHALIGENGAGKSTLMKIFGGIHQADKGRILINGREIKFGTPGDALAAGVIVIPQELQVVASQSVAENVLLGQLPEKSTMGFLPGIDRKAMAQRTSELLQKFYLNIDPNLEVERLSFAERQIVMIARALNHQAKFLILDEPTAALETREVDRIFEVIETLKGLEVAVAFVSHRLDEVETIADFCTIFRDGRKVEHNSGNVPSQTEMARLMTGRDLEKIHHGGSRSVSEPVIQIDHTNSGTKETHKVSVGKGEILGLAGLLGAGMTEFLLGSFGAGEKNNAITIGGFRVDLSSPAVAIKQGIGLVPNERSQGLIMGLTVRENIILPNLNKFTTRRGLDNRAITKFVTELIEAVDIRPQAPDKIVRELSGGNQQKVIFARWLAGHVNVLLLDEPTHGVDVGAKAQIHKIMNEFAEKGGGIVFASSELTEVLSISDSVLTMRSGDIVARISRRDEYNEKVLREALGGS